MNNKYYFSINTTSLAHYIEKAIILPSRFYSNRPNDIQNLSGDYLLLSNIPFVNESDCSIELILTEDEINNLKEIESNILLLNKPLPISRIKHIYFFTDEKKLLTIAKINDGSGFINEKIVNILENTDKNVLKIEMPEIEKFSYSNEFESKIKDFDHKLGGLAFGRFNTENKYNINYFSTLSCFNSYIKEEYEKNCIQKSPTSYEGFFNISGKWKDLASLIYETIEEKDVIISADKEKISILKNDVTGMFELDEIDSKTNTYKLAILSTYGSNSTKRQSIDDLVSKFLSDSRVNKIQEPISLIFGINNGYSVFYNKYKEKTVKFRMDSMLDYYTIESVFQYVINANHSSDRFKYLNSIINEKSSIDDLYFKTYTILDETVITEFKTPMSDAERTLHPTLFDWFKSLIEKFLKKKCEVEILLDQKEEENKKLESKFQLEQKKRADQQEKNSEILEEVKKLEETNNELDTKTTCLNQDIKHIEFQLQEEKNKNKELVNQSNDLKENTTRLSHELAENQAQLKDKEGEIKALINKVNELSKYNDELNTTNQNNKSQLQEEKIKFRNIVQDVEILAQELEKTKKELEQEYKKNNELEANLEKARGIYLEQKSKIRSFEVKKDEISQQNNINLNGMRKPELLELAKQKGINVSNRDTVKQLVDKINTNFSSLL